MQNVMKKCSAAILLAIALCLGLAIPQQALAAPGDPTATVELKEVAGSADSTDVYLTTNQVDARTFSVALQVKTDTPDYVNAAFTWDKAIEGENGSAASLLWAEPARTDSGLIVTLYAGDLANEPFKSGESVKLGTLKLSAASGMPSGEEARATVQLLPGDHSVAFAAYRSSEVTVTEPAMMPQDGIELTVQAVETPDPGDKPQQVDDVKQSPDILGETPDTNGKNLPSTGDQMMPIAITLVCVAVLAVAIIVVMAIRRKRNGQAADKQ